jgi:hypothetical protein
MHDELDLRTLPLFWQPMADARFPHAAHARNRRYVLRLDDFPAELVHTLMHEGEALLDFDDWPSAWIGPAAQ